MITQELLDAITFDREQEIARIRLAVAAQASKGPQTASPRSGLWRVGLTHDGLLRGGRNIVPRSVDPTPSRSS